MNAILPLPACIERRDRLAARLSRLTAGLPRPLAPATYLGIQEGFESIPAIELWNLTADIPGYKAGGTVSSATLIAAGYRLPAR